MLYLVREVSSRKRIVGSTSDEAVRDCFDLATRKELGAEPCFPIVGCPYFVRVIVIVREMIEFALSIRKDYSEKAKKLLRWLLCTSSSVTDCATISFTGGGLVEMRGDHHHRRQPQQQQQQLKSSTETLESEPPCAEAVSADAVSADAVTFQNLPAECKLRVLSYLTIDEKGRAETVCSEWRDLIRTPLLWKCIDLTQFELRCRCPGRSCSDAGCYDAYKDRMERFLVYLARIRPNLTQFRFAFDIIDSQDDWLRLLRSFIDSVRIQKLELAQLNWKETPAKPYPSESAVTWSSSNYNDLMYRHRRRQRHFVGFFDYFTASATNLTTLILPFDWSPSTIKHLTRLRRLESLVLQSYFVPQPFEQETLDDLLSAVPTVEHLSVTVSVGSGLGVRTYRLASKRLRSLDLSRCQGFSLGEVRLPALNEFRTGCKAYASPFVDPASTAPAAPCIYEVLRCGAPALLTLNGHGLRPGWRDASYEELESVLRGACACAVHKPV